MILVWGSNSGKITYNLNGSDRHMMTSTGLGINTTSPGTFALNVSGATLLLTSSNVSGFTRLINYTTFISSLNVSSFATLFKNISLVSSLNVPGFTIFSNNSTMISALNVLGFTTLMIMFQ